MDSLGVARLYTTLKRASRRPTVNWVTSNHSTALEQAIVTLLHVPVLDREVAMVPKGALYRYEDPCIEGLTGAQKQLARMGPRHVRIIQNKLRAVARQLDIPAERLPE